MTEPNIQISSNVDLVTLERRGVFGVDIKTDHTGIEMIRFYLVWRSPVHLSLIETLQGSDPRGVQIRAENVATKGGHDILAAPMPPRVASIVIWRDWIGDDYFEAVRDLIFNTQPEGDTDE